MKAEMPRRRNRAWGFTSIEVLAATALASLLMVAVLGVLAGIAKKEKSLESSSLSPRWHDQIVRRLRADLRSAARLRIEPGRVILEACSENDANHPAWAPAEIHYFVVDGGEYLMLLRHEYPRIQPAPSRRPEVICLGIDGILLRPYVQTPSAGSDSRVLANGVVPPRLRVVLTKKGTPVLDHPVVLY